MNNQATVVTSLNQINDVLKSNNIELVTFDHVAFYDTYLSQFYFDEFKSEWEDKSLWFGNNGSDYIVFFANKELMENPYYKVSNLRKMTKSALYGLCEQYEILNYHYSEYDISDNTKQMLIDELMRYVDYEKYYTYHYNESSYRDLDYDFSIVGYSQGDKVLIKMIGTEKEFLNSDKCNLIDEKSLTNLFYDSPMCLKIECFVNDELYEEIDLIEFIDMYSYYEKSDCIDAIEKHYKDFKYYDLLVDYVESNFPKSLSYH